MEYVEYLLSRKPNTYIATMLYKDAKLDENIKLILFSVGMFCSSRNSTTISWKAFAVACVARLYFTLGCYCYIAV